MLAVKRREGIISLLNEKKSVTVSELSSKFKVTEETIRKDLKILEGENKLTRAYGGAFIQSGVKNNVDINIREVVYVENKKKIAKSCRNIVENGDTIFLDPSTTALFIAKELSNMRITVATNSLLIAHELSDKENVNLLLIGGNLTRDYMCFTGQFANGNLTQMFFDKVFMSCRSISLEKGVTDSSENLSEIRKNLLGQCNECYLVADQTKFDNVSFIKICDIERLSGIITDKQLDSAWLEEMKKKKIEYIFSK